MPKIAVLMNAPVPLLSVSVRCELFVEGMRANGLDALTMCPDGSESGYPHPVLTYRREARLEDPTYWRSLGLDGAIVFTWHRMTPILLAIRAAGLSTLAIVESDSRISPRLHPWSTFQSMTLLQPSLRGKIGAAKYWLERFLLRSGGEHRALVDNASASDVLTFAGEGAADEFRHLLRRLGVPDLADRVAWLPYPVPGEFCSAEVAPTRSRRVIAVGRWDSPQKDPALLASTIRRLHAAGDRTEFLIVGRRASERFGPVAAGNPRVHLLGVQARERVRELMAGCRSVLIPSRWESGPIVANEMLALGGTVIGAPIVNLTALTSDGRFGRVSLSRAPAALADAIRSEMSAWDRGGRDPAAIAAHWRPLLGPSAVAGRMLDLLGMGAAMAGPSGGIG